MFSHLFTSMIFSAIFVLVLTILRKCTYIVGLMQNARPTLPTTCPLAFSDLISRCWSSNPKRRPNFEEIVSILESYTEAFEEDPTFFSSFKPSQHSKLLQRCIPQCFDVPKASCVRPKEHIPQFINVHELGCLNQ